MLNLGNLNQALLSKMSETSDTIIFTIKDDMSIIDFSSNFKLQSKNFENLYELITYTHRSAFLTKLNQCKKEKSIESFRTNFSFDKTDVEDIPSTYNITMQYIQQDQIMIVAEVICQLSKENAKEYFSMINDYSAISRKLQKSKYILDKKNIQLKESIKEIQLKDEIMLSQSKETAMGDMISMVAHQWRQPLSVLSMDINNFLMSIELEEEITTDYLLEFGSKFSKEIQQLSKSITGFSNFFESSKSKEKITIEDIFKDIFNLIGKSLKNNNITLNIDNTSKSILFINKSLFIQVLLNVLGNAQDVLLAKKTPRATININIVESKEDIIISICDNAGGIPESIIDKLAEPYFTTKNELNGVGLGLYISQTIIKKHLFGTLTWHNTGEGACFVITLKLEN